MSLKKLGIPLAIVVSICIWLTSCSSKNLKDQRAQEEIEYVLLPGSHVKVENGIATFSGTFQDEASMKEAEQVARANKHIKSIVNRATIAPKTELARDTVMAAQ